jgi:predicted metal-binding membrane protein
LAALCVLTLAGLGWFYVALLVAGHGADFVGLANPVLRVLCGPLQTTSWSMTRIAVVAVMWAAMALAMMLPSAAPMIMTYAGIADTAARKNETIVSPFMLATGYMVVWFGFALFAAIAQIMPTHVALLNGDWTSTDKLFSGAIFIGAGLYQFSALKHACLTRCQQPFPFFFANWTTKPAGVFRLGLRQGLFCLGCCWAMMLVMFAVGVMNVAWMAGLAIVMTIEKMIPGRRFTSMIGIVLIMIGAGIMAAALAGYWRVALS